MQTIFAQIKGFPPIWHSVLIPTNTTYKGWKMRSFSYLLYISLWKMNLSLDQQSLLPELLLDFMFICRNRLNQLFENFTQCILILSISYSSPESSPAHPILCHPATSCCLFLLILNDFMTLNLCCPYTPDPSGRAGLPVRKYALKENWLSPPSETTKWP